MASVGHVRDLPDRNPKGVKDPVPGVDLEKRLQADLPGHQGKGQNGRRPQEGCQDAAGIWLATDLDREGEAIAWHLAEALGISPGTGKRVVFNAITRSEVERAFKNPRRIDMDKVNAQQARRILDRIVGYQVSPLLWRKVAGGLSAGRVQSVAVRLIVQREREIESFVPRSTGRYRVFSRPVLEKRTPFPKNGSGGCRRRARRRAGSRTAGPLQTRTGGSRNTTAFAPS